jgi:serine/threonine protein kinase
MKSRVASVRTPGGLDRVDRVVQMLEDEWQRCGKVQLERFWKHDCGQGVVTADAIGLLAELVKVDLRCRFERGETPTAASYFELFPELQAAHSNVLSLVYEEYCLHEERGARPDVESFCNRYPDWKSSLVSQLQYHRNLSQLAGGKPPLPPFPAVGDDFLEFRLKAPLGEGGVSRVYLARDLSLGGKQVVLKVTLDRGQEPSVHGPLDHPHIVPVNSVVYHTKDNLRGLSMPYRPGLPLDLLITKINPGAQSKKAIFIWQSLVKGTSDTNGHLHRSFNESEPLGDDALTTVPNGVGWARFPVRGSYAQGVAWIVMILARALHYAHRKNTFHRDVKPANVLLTLQHGPQLLDFNLAESPHSVDNAQLALHGGTLPYMAPEQIEAFMNPDLWNQVGARADIYSLGLVLRELLTGQKPAVPDRMLPPPRALRAALDSRPFLDVDVRRINPSIPPSLQAIVAKCLTLSQDDRYPDAAALERDLDHFLRYQPLPFAGNPSHREQIKNWVVRNRRVLTGTACTIVLCATLYSLWRVRPAGPPKGPSVETLLEFKLAREEIKQDKPELAVFRFVELEAKFQRNFLVKFYHSMALDRLARKRYEDGKTKTVNGAPLKPFDDKNHVMDDALNDQEAASTLRQWAKNHRDEVLSYLVEFASSRMLSADEFIDHWDRSNNPGSREAMTDEERDSEVLRPKYGPAKDALLLAEMLDPASGIVQRLLARSELVFADEPAHYLAAYQRLSREIELLRSDETLDVDAIFYCRALRSAAAFRGAEQERRAGKVNDDTLNRMLEAVNDLKICARRFDALPFDNLDDDAKRKYYHNLHDRLRATVTLAEVEMDLNNPQDCRTHLVSGLRTLDRLVQYIDSNGLNGKVPKTDDLDTRLERGCSRFLKLDAATGPHLNHGQDARTVVGTGLDGRY